MYRLLTLCMIFAGCAARALAQPAPPATATDIDALARRVAGNGTTQERTALLVSWINHEFAWTATDYQQRTPEQIIERRAGNCADLAKVLARLLDGVHIQYRFVREINVQPESESRQANAERKMTTGGVRFSVFGRRHNDHTWLEVADRDSGNWIPADPAVGVVGIKEWISARLAFEQRRQPLVAATVGIVASMLEPFAVAAGAEDRSTYYLVEEFDRAYGNRLRRLPAWTDWCSLVGRLAPVSMGALSGAVNLHEYAAQIGQVAEAYGALRRQAAEAGVTLSQQS